MTLPWASFHEAPSLLAARFFSDWQHSSSYEISNTENQRLHVTMWMWPWWTRGPPSICLSVLFRSRTCQSGCKIILKRVWCNITGPEEKCSAFPLMIWSIMVMPGHQYLSQFGQMVLWITEYPRKHLDGMAPGALTWIMKHFVKCLTRSRDTVQLGWHSPF